MDIVKIVLHSEEFGHAVLEVRFSTHRTLVDRNELKTQNAEDILTLAIEVHKLRQQLAEQPTQAQDKIDAYADKYHELILAVVCKFSNESRHETALRYIRERENRPISSACDAAIANKKG